MSVVIDALSWASLLVGGAFGIVGALGLLRLPDLFTRLHASGVIDIPGVGFIVLGLVLQAGWSLVTAKLLVLMLLVIFTSPTATHAVARAAMHMGVRPRLADREGPPSKP